MSICSKTGCHAVLAPLSGCYPPLEGRSPTCYSPVRHSTQGRSPFRVRLACVRHAASVDSEPGSNSQVKVGRFRSPQPKPGPTRARQSFNASSLLKMALRCFAAPRSARPSRSSDLRTASPHLSLSIDERQSRNPSAVRLILDGLPPPLRHLRSSASAGQVHHPCGCQTWCLHVLSSFQRTGQALSGHRPFEHGLPSARSPRLVGVPKTGDLTVFRGTLLHYYDASWPVNP